MSFTFESTGPLQIRKIRTFRTARSILHPPRLQQQQRVRGLERDLHLRKQRLLPPFEVRLPTVFVILFLGLFNRLQLHLGLLDRRTPLSP